jgi:hypothetical protein
MFAIEGWGSPTHVRNIMQKIEEDNQKVGKTGRIVREAPAPKPKRDKIWAQWALDVPLESMLERV